MISFTFVTLGSGPIPTPGIVEMHVEMHLDLPFYMLYHGMPRKPGLLPDDRLLPKLASVTAGPDAKSKQDTSSSKP